MKAIHVSIRTFLVALAALLLVSPKVHSEEAANPEVTAAGQVALDFAKAMLKGDVVAAKGLAMKADEPHVESALKSEAPTDFVPSLVKATGNEKQALATVLFPGKLEVPLLLAKEDGKWKVAFLETMKAIAAKANAKAPPKK